MKNVAGFQSFDRWDFVGIFDLSLFLKGFGTIESHKEGCAMRGRLSVEMVRCCAHMLVGRIL